MRQKNFDRPASNEFRSENDSGDIPEVSRSAHKCVHSPPRQLRLFQMRCRQKSGGAPKGAKFRWRPLPEFERITRGIQTERTATSL
jgi:hypothetical protein